MLKKTTSAKTTVEREGRERGNIYRRLSLQLDTTAHFHELGGDPVVGAIANAKGFREHDLVILRIGHGPRIFTVVVAPVRNWTRRKADLIAVKREAAASGLAVLLMPARWLKMPERSRNRDAIAAAMRQYGNVARHTALLEFVRKRGTASLAECTLRSRDGGLGPLLSLWGRGWFSIDRSSRITGDSVVAWAGGGSTPPEEVSPRGPRAERM